MLAKELYRIIATEESTHEYLISKGLLQASSDSPLCRKCGTKMQIKRRISKLRDGSIRGYPSYRCPKRGCQTFESIRKANAFFTYTDLNGRCNSNLTLGQILEICYYWAHNEPQHKTCAITGRAANSITDWYNLCRDIPMTMFDSRGLMGGEGHIIQIDESLLRGKRKYNRGRFCGGETVTVSLVESDANATNITNQRNHGRRISGPWVFGLCWRTQKHGIDVVESRFFAVEKRDTATLLPIIKAEVASSSTIHSDEWMSYNSLQREGFTHETVNHQINFVNPVNGANTQLIECMWSIIKFKVLRQMHGTTPEMLPRHLKEMWWRSINPRDKFCAILRDIN